MGNFFKSIAVLLSVPLLLSGCNSSATSAENQQSSIQEEENLSDNANENTSTEASKEQITLTFSYWGDKNELACKEELIKDFEAAHPNIKIEATYTDGVSYHTKLQTFFTSGAAPDVKALQATSCMILLRKVSLKISHHILREIRLPGNGQMVLLIFLPNMGKYMLLLMSVRFLLWRTIRIFLMQQD